MADKLLVTAQWDDEASVWVATSDDIPGLVTEAATLDDLLKRIIAVTPELLADNAQLIDGSAGIADLLDLHVISHLSAAQ